MGATQSGTHRWRFFRAGGVDQVRLERGEDIVRLDQLDQKLWVALSCPVHGLHFDERTLDLLDVDRDGRVRVPEIIGAIRWLRAVLRDPETLTKGADLVALANLDETTPEGREVLGAARHILAGLGKPDASAVTLEDTQKTAEVFARARLNGDGVVPPDVIEAADARGVAEQVVACLGGLTDRSGKAGFDEATLESFFAACEAYDAWWREGEEKSGATWPLGDATASAAAALDAVRGKINDWFQRVELASFDARAEAALNRGEEDYRALAAKDLSKAADEIEAFPLALVAPGRSLPLHEGLNPAWATRMACFVERVVTPVLGAGLAHLTREAWIDLDGRFGAWRTWEARRRGAEVAALGIERVRWILASPTRAALEAAIQEDLSVAPAVQAMQQVERLTRYHRDLHRLLDNFVTFADFYRRREAVFQAGKLYLDGRSCDLCVKVEDPAKHGVLATMAKTFLVYADCRRPSGETMTVAAAVTAGESDNLFVGRNGLFYDRAGRDWDARITKIVNHPISIGQAFWSPYKKVLRWIEETVAKRAAAADEAATARLQSTTTGVVETSGKAPPPKKIDVGTVAAIGVAVGGMTAALGVLLQAFFGLGFLMPLGVLGLVLLISGPSMLIAWLKLRQRNLGPILDANGWAVNTLTKVNLPLGRSLTALAALPPGAQRSLRDPFAPRRRRWPWVLVLLFVLGGAGFVLWKLGRLSDWFCFVPPPQERWLESPPCQPPASPLVPAPPPSTTPPGR